MAKILTPSKQSLLVTIGAMGILMALWMTAAALQTRAPQLQTDKKFLKPPEAIKNFTFGYNDMFASLLWIRLLQNFDYCEGGKYDGSEFVPPVDSASDKIAGIVERKMNPSRCHKGWVYSMLDSISTIEPRFDLAYDTGALFLSVIVDDREGARLLFDKGLKVYPDNWSLNYHAGYHYLWEMQDVERAAPLFERASRNGAPKWVSALSAALYTKAGQAQVAKSILEEALLTNPKGRDEERIKKRLEEVDALLQEK